MGIEGESVVGEMGTEGGSARVVAGEGEAVSTAEEGGNRKERDTDGVGDSVEVGEV